MALGIFVEACGIFCCGARASLYLWHAGFLFSGCGVQAPGYVGSVVCGTWAVVEVRELSSCGVPA